MEYRKEIEENNRQESLKQKIVKTELGTPWPAQRIFRREQCRMGKEKLNKRTREKKTRETSKSWITK